MPSARQLLGCTACWCCIDTGASTACTAACFGPCAAGGPYLPAQQLPLTGQRQTHSSHHQLLLWPLPALLPQCPLHKTSAPPSTLPGQLPGAAFLAADHICQDTHLNLHSIACRAGFNLSAHQRAGMSPLVLAMLRLLLPGLDTRPTPAAAQTGDRPDAAWSAAKSATNTNTTTCENVCARCMLERSQRPQLARARYFLDISAR